MTTSTHHYRYLAPSSCEPAAAGISVDLSTSGGRDPNPFLFTGTLDRPRQAARCLLTIASVARSRFYDPMTAAKAELLDPVITVHDDLLRFEAFSTCCSVYARFDQVSPHGALARGTTNIDVNPPMRAALSGARDRGDLLLSVGHDSVTVTTDRGGAVERKVPLPERWLKGFVEVQLASAGFVRRFELGGPAARRLLQQLPTRATSTPTWIVPSGSGARLSRQPGPDAVFVDAPFRLRPLVDLVAFVERLVVHAPVPNDARLPGGVTPEAPAEVATHAQPSAWEAHLPDARLVLIMSPQLSRGFSGEGAVLLHAALGDRSAAARLAAVLDGQRHLDERELTEATGLDRLAVTSGLAQLGMLGRLGYDLDTDGYFHRDLPFDRERLERLHPRLRDARDLVAAGAVTVIADGDADVASGDTTYRVRSTATGQRCTCRWDARTAGAQGPCKHVLAVLLSRDAPATAPATDPAARRGHGVGRAG